MSSTSDDESRAGGPSKGRSDKSEGPTSKGGAPQSPAPSSDEHQLDIEPDALLDSLLADGDDLVDGPLDSEHDGSFPDEEEVTGVHAPPPTTTPRRPAPVDEFSDVDELLTESSPPPESALPPKAPPVAVKSAKATLQGIRPAVPRPPGATRPGIPRPQAREFSAPAAPPPRRPAEPASRQTSSPPEQRPAEPALPKTSSPPEQRRAEPTPPKTSSPPEQRRAEPGAPKASSPPVRRSVEPASHQPTRKPPPVNPAGPPPREPFLPAMSPKAPPARVRKLAPEPDVDDNSSDEEPTFRAYVTEADLEASRNSSFDLADALEPDQGTDSSESYPPDFEDLDEDILESVPPDPPDSLAPGESEPPELEAYEIRDSAPGDSLPPESFPGDSLPPLASDDALPAEPFSAPSPRADLPATASSLPPAASSLTPSISSVPPAPSAPGDLHEPAARARFSSVDGFGRASVDTLLEDEHTELVDSIPPDEALGTYRSERSAQEHLAEAGLVDEWRTRAEWFERQAQSTLDPAAKARALLVASEHFALVGDISKARSVASEIHAVQPTMTLGSRQLRWLAAAEQDHKAVAGALELETRASPTPLARAHAANLAADIQRVCFDDVAGARRKLDLAARVLPSDPRPYTLRMAEQLGQTAAPPRLRWPEIEELAPLVRVADELERLRGPAKPADSAGTTHATTLEEARRALATRDVKQALVALKRLSRARGLRRAALWLGAALAAHSDETRPTAIEMLRDLVAKDQSLLARQALAARAVEQGDAAGARAALYQDDALSPAFDAATRVALGVLTGSVPASITQDLEELAGGALRPLAAAADAAAAPLSADPGILTGDERQQNEILAGRALAALLLSGDRRSLAPPPSVPSGNADAASSMTRLRLACERIARQHGPRALTQILDLEFALAEGRAGAIAETLAAWPGMETGPQKALVSALALEVSGDRAAAKRALKQALVLDPDHEGATRALLNDASPAEAAELLGHLAEAKDDPAQAGFLLLEAALRRTDDPKASDELLVQAAASAPELPLVYLQGEQQARQRGDADLLLNWLRQRREAATDSIDRAFDYVREALLVAESDMTLAASLLGDAVAARPHDIALQELHDRLTSQSGVERGRWREEVADQVSDESRQRLLLEAALEYERALDIESAARVATKAKANSQSPFVALTAERLNIARGNSAALSEALLKSAREETDARAQRELYERLSELDEAKGDHASALLWQSAILERTPDYLPALRRLEHEYISTGRWDDLEPIALTLARQLDPSEASAHATFVTHQRILSGRWDQAREAIALACKNEHPNLWALRAFAGQARGSDDLEASLRGELELMHRATTPLDVATLSLRAAEAATRLGKLDAARALLQRAIQQVPNHLVALTTLADVLEAMGAAHEAAEALEAAATAFQTTKHQVEMWHQAAVLWQDAVNDEQRAIHALEAALERDITHSEAFRRLQDVYVRQRETQKLADLLERRLERTTDRDERIAIEVMRGQALAGVGEKQAAREALAAALDANPEHAVALGAYAELCMDEGDWSTAEQAWIRLARHVDDPKQQALIYTRLGALYDEQLPNPERAERAYQEVLKRDPDSVQALTRLVEVYVALRDQERAVALQQQLIERATTDEQKRDHTLGLARVYERLSPDPKQSVAILEQAKKTYGHDSHVLRAHAELLQRRGEDRVLAMLLDRAASDARRALGTGRFDTAFFEILSTVSDLRGATDGAIVARSTLAALKGEATELSGAGPRVADPHLDELLAPTALSAPLRILLQKSGHVLDTAYPVDLRALRAGPLPPESQQLQEHVEQVASAFGIDGVEVLVSPALGAICMPVSSAPARLVYGESLLSQTNAVARYFLLIRALKILQTGAATLSRTAPIDLWPLLAGFLNVFAANWEPQGADARKTAQATQRIKQVMTAPLDNDVPMLALEVIGSIGNRASQLSVAANQFGNRAGLLAVGDPASALEGVALAAGQDKGLPPSLPERLRWIVRNSEARDLAIFSVTDQYVQARQALGVGST